MTYPSGDPGQEGSWYQSGRAQPERGYDDFPLPMSPYSRPPKRPPAGRIALISIAVVAIIMIAGVVIVKVLPGKQSTNNTAGSHPTAHSPSGDAEQIAAAFLRAWSGGDLSAAAGLTDDPADAHEALAAYRQGLNLRKLTATVTGTAAASPPAVPAGMPPAGAAASTTLERVAFTVTATVAGSAGAAAVSGTWSYRSTLTAYQVPDGSGWFIQWLPSVLAPNLSNGQQLAAVAVPPQDTSVTDSAGHPLSAYDDPGLANVANEMAAVAPNHKGVPGLAVQIEDASDGAVSGGQTTIIAATAGRVATTISPQAEQAARAAVSAVDGSAIAAIQPSTGHILAIANNSGFNDYALTAEVAPGSTMKIITATALIDSGLVSESSPVGCPAAYTVQGVTFHNDQDGSEPAGTPFSYDFAQSCNNAFDQWWTRLSGQLASTAQTYYGLNQPWNIGIPGQPVSYFNAPSSASGSELAEEAFGEGLLTACPLAMASVAATVDAGQFRQPVLLPGGTTVSAQPLPPGTDAQLKDMMRDVVTEGTAAGLGFGPGIYAKTGTADIQNQDNPNSWIVAFDPDRDIAVAALVVNAGYGAQVAGPEVKTFFDQYRA
jgi:Penicillin binding protein transpeptidase domain/NTF2-like N-terminal transpeptidase domain